MVAKRSPWVSFPARQLAGFTGAALQRSVHALSSATGSSEAAMPMSPTRGTSFIAWQSQWGDTSHTNDMWKQGFPRTTAAVYSAILPCITVQGSPKSLMIASRLHTPYAAAAAHALRGVDIGLAPLSERACFVRALLRAAAAAHALLLIHSGMHRGVHGLLAAARAAAHAEVLERAADACHLMAFEVVEGDHHVSIHKSAADVRLLHVLAVGQGHSHVVRAAQTVRNDHVATGGEWREAVFVRGSDVLERVLAAANVERVGVREERMAALLLHEVCEGLCPVRTQIREASRLAEVRLDRHKLVGQVDLSKPCRFKKPSELLLQILRIRAAEVCEKYCCFLHGQRL